MFTYDQCIVDWFVYMLNTMKSGICVAPYFLFPNSKIVMDTDIYTFLADIYLIIKHFSKMTVNRNLHLYFETSSYITFIICSMISQLVNSTTLSKYLLWVMFYKIL